jgi:AraC-like DNA-binding protein
MLENLAFPLDLGTLATRAHMSRRTLSRRFRDETGVSPMAWLADARIDRAREILETTTEPVENIGRPTGLCRAGLGASGLPPADRHLTEGVPCCLAGIVVVNAGDGDGSTLLCQRASLSVMEVGEEQGVQLAGEVALESPRACPMIHATRPRSRCALHRRYGVCFRMDERTVA